MKLTQHADVVNAFERLKETLVQESDAPVVSLGKTFSRTFHFKSIDNISAVSAGTYTNENTKRV
jgi:hypothetical protein